MNAIVLTVIILSVIGVLAGLLLSVASIVMAVKKDEKAEKIEAALPGANCGSCGFSGCSGYAAALADGQTEDTNLCSPGGEQAAAAIAEILGVTGGGFVRKTAVVRCRGNWDVTDMKMEYKGLATCFAANQQHAGIGACRFGCIGFGDCAAVCEYGAITVENGLASIDPDKCVACGKCVQACPKSIIALVPAADEDRTVLCRSADKGAVTRKACSAGCIGCMQCVKACEHGAVTVSNFLASIDPEKCVGCGKCEAVCPQHCIASFAPAQVK